MKAILFDMDGVLYNTDTPILAADETLAWVRERQIPHLFVTNTSSRGRSELVEKLARMGIAAGQEDILTPAYAASQWLRLQETGRVALFVHRRTAHEDFKDFDLIDEEAEIGARYVVVGDLGEKWDFFTLNRAFRLLQVNPEAVLVALGKTRYWQASDGLRLDVAPFVAALECATQREALVFGKPSQLFFKTAEQRLGVAAGDIVMVGDDIEVDIGGAQKAGMHGLLVRTGKFRGADLEGPVKPDVMLDSIADLPGWWRALEKRGTAIAGHE